MSFGTPSREVDHELKFDLDDAIGGVTHGSFAGSVSIEIDDAI
jgi:hypothetical protein